jgi:hypothetical protein
MLRSILSVLAGFFVWSALWLAANQAFRAITPGSFHEDGSVEGSGVLLMILAWSVVCSVAAGWVTGTVAKANPVKHATWLGVVQVLVGIAVQMGYWEVIPLWYHLCFLALLLPGHVVGGWMKAGKR